MTEGGPWNEGGNEGGDWVAIAQAEGVISARDHITITEADDRFAAELTHWGAPRAPGPRSGASRADPDERRCLDSAPLRRPHQVSGSDILPATDPRNRGQDAADSRDVAADNREVEADARETLADARERAADEREARADAREDALDRTARALRHEVPSLLARAHSALDRQEDTIARTREQIERSRANLKRLRELGCREQREIDRESASSAQDMPRSS